MNQRPLGYEANSQLSTDLKNLHYEIFIALFLPLCVGASSRFSREDIFRLSSFVFIEAKRRETGLGNHCSIRLSYRGIKN